MAHDSSRKQEDVISPSYPDVIPMIAYEDGPSAMDWLAEVFGFKKRARIADPGGRLSHGEMQAREGVSCKK
jgi:PhnB protein